VKIPARRIFRMISLSHPVEDIQLYVRLGVGAQLMPSPGVITIGSAELNAPVDPKPGLPSMNLPDSLNGVAQTTNGEGTNRASISAGDTTTPNRGAGCRSACWRHDGFKSGAVPSFADDAIQIIGSRKFHSVFIQDTVPGDYIRPDRHGSAKILSENPRSVL